MGRGAPSTTARASRRRSDRGASAVEFGLVSMLLFPLMFGIIQYGLWFNDSLNVRQGVREAARQGVVKSFDHPGCTGNDMAKLACKTKKEIAALSGDTYVKISAPGGWNKAAPLVVCAMVKSSIIGLVPLPEDAMVTSRTEMSIEVTDAAPNSLSYTDPAPSGANWTWCS